MVNAEMQVVGVIDWEFTYAAPAEFSSAPTVVACFSNSPNTGQKASKIGQGHMNTMDGLDTIWPV
ncbi:hypothetical protein P175DRAFT_0556285 [Aspergillus ochraceoroseus IBT 24754]|uniref:Uncharacterized protein n=1 Tax=Aspergillus ochraceoroseus IBT 24754 TaxID=1392256 RepID=A0A2T5LYF1_9EURO|nr:uncharacterized protein P175DRAFT_0556285 [Aspergillus ochraceoroseus IBT 24754]PTU21308.1 hypothetical protein P175DRAFT_0556285 [Aspergillus ochraceoroseus IBT 24754]